MSITPVFIINEHGNYEIESIEGFCKIWHGNAMIFDRNNIGINTITINQIITNFLNLFKKPFIYISVFCLFSSLLFYKIEQRNIFNVFYLIFSCIGLFFSVLLIIENLDEHNPLVRSFCISKKSKKVNCSSILNSKDAYFLGILSWSDIGFVYFSFIFLLNLIQPDKISYAVSCLVSVMALPYVFYSITYQKFVAKSWCRLCLGVQVIIVSLFTTSLFSYRSFNLNFFSQTLSILSVLLISMVIISALAIIKPLLLAFYEVNAIKTKYSHLKHTPEVQQFLFSNQQKIDSPLDCALTLGNTTGKNVLTLVLNPTCNPCMNELRILLPILRRKDNTRVDVLFLVDKDDDIHSAILAEELIERYLMNTIDFLVILEDYVNNYPRSKYSFVKKMLQDNANKKSQQTLERQQKWGEKNRVYSTPQIFLNYNRIPEYYTTKDIDYMCS